MDYIHITEKQNLDSIKKLGLIPKRAYLSTHRESFKYYLKTDKVIYFTKFEDKEKTGRYIQDFVYFQLWGKPRNIWGGKNYGHWEDVFSQNFKIEHKEFVILKVKIDLTGFNYLTGCHSQDNTLPLLKDMDMRFAHGDKPLLVMSKPMSPQRIEESGHVYPVIRNNKIENVKLFNW